MHTDLIDGHRIVFVDDGQRVPAEQLFQSVVDVTAAVCIVNVICGEQDLGDCVVILGKQLVVGIHQLALTHCGSSLLTGHIRGTTGKPQLAHAHADSAGGDQNDLASGIFHITEHLAQKLHTTDIQPSAAVGEGGGTDLYNDSHRYSLSFLKLPVIVQQFPPGINP